MAVHLAERGARLLDPRLLRQAGQGIGPDPVLGHVVSIEVRDAEEVLRARFAAISGGADVGQGLRPLAALEQQQAVHVGSLDMAALRRLAEQVFGLAQVGLDAPAQLVGLAQVELRIGIALVGRSLPFAHRARIVPARPGVDAGLDVGEGGSGRQKRRRRDRHRNPKAALHHDPFPAVAAEIRPRACPKPRGHSLSRSPYG